VARIPVIALLDDVSAIMCRMVREKLAGYEGQPLFPDHWAYTENCELSPLEAVRQQRRHRHKPKKNGPPPEAPVGLGGGRTP
jgi:hypothetical protein